jgi:pseudouridine-5'-phosphate glycosidase
VVPSAQALGIGLEHRVDSPSEAARLTCTLTDLRAESAILVCNPISANDVTDGEEVAVASRGRGPAPSDRSRIGVVFTVQS